MIPPKKSLGQNFLKSKEALRDIVSAARVSSTDTVLEIGPGKGVLTEELLKIAGKVVAVEKDDRLIEFLHEKFKKELEAGKLEILHQDILEFNPAILDIEKEGEDERKTYKLVANIPYYITGMIIEQFLSGAYQPELMVLLVQKEVAQRIVARDEKESILSMSVRAYGNPKYISTVKAKYFSPEPKVDSAIILIDKISKDFFFEFTEQEYFDAMKLGFAHKRKMLIGNLSEKYSRAKLVEIFNKLGINEKARAEDLELSSWKQLVPELIQLTD